MVRKSKAVGLVVAAVAFNMAAPQGSGAAEIKRVNRSACNFLLSGEIVRGDLDRFKSSGIKAGDSLCLNSPGGDYHSGLDISEALLGEAIRTVVDKDEECYSSCALVFMGGSTAEDGYLPLRSMHLRATLGFHAPYVLPREQNYSKEIVQAAYASGLQAVARMMTLGNGIIPNSVILELLKKGPSEFYSVDTVQKAQELSIELVGMPSVNAWNMQALCNACWNKHHAPTGMWTTACDPRFQSQVTRTTVNPATTQFRLPNFGPEAGYECAVRVKNDQSKRISSIQLYYELVESDTRLDEQGFIDVPNYFGLPSNYPLGKAQ